MRNRVTNREQLVAALREQGVDYLAPSDAVGGPMDNQSLLASLAGHTEPRLRQALIALFLVQPHLASQVPALRGQLDPATEDRLAVYYMAAVYLQRIWEFRLRRDLPRYAVLPDYFSAEMGLPPPAANHGELGLRALAEREEDRLAHAGNPLSEFEGNASLILQRVEQR